MNGDQLRCVASKTSGYVVPGTLLGQGCWKWPFITAQGVMGNFSKCCVKAVKSSQNQ